MRAHVREIERCNQRGGRFLSIVDLIEAETLDMDTAAYLGAAILGGNSFLVGALPGGAGKTTVMGALLNFVPADTPLVAATEGVPARFRAGGGPRHCLICHEIGQGPYFAYLWGRDARDFFALPAAGHMGATNLHADDAAQARAILCGGCKVPAADFEAWPLMLFLALEPDGRRGVRRRVGAILEGPGRLVYAYAGGRWRREEAPLLAAEPARARVRELIETLCRAGKRTLADVREALLDRFSARDGDCPPGPERLG